MQLINHVAFSPNGRFVRAQRRGPRLPTKTLHPRHSLTPPQPPEILFLRTNHPPQVASASFDKSVKLWNGLTGAFVSSLRAHVGPVYMVAWSSDSRLLLSASRDSTLKLWETRSQKFKLDLPGHADEVYAVDWSPRGGHVASGGKDRTLRLWRQ